MSDLFSSVLSSLSLHSSVSPFILPNSSYFAHIFLLFFPFPSCLCALSSKIFLHSSSCLLFFSSSISPVAVALRNQKVRIAGGYSQFTKVSSSVSMPTLSQLTVCFEVERTNTKQVPMCLRSCWRSAPDTSSPLVVFCGNLCDSLGSRTERVDLHLLRQQQHRGVEFWRQPERHAADRRQGFLLHRSHHLLQRLHFLHEAVLCPLDVHQRPGGRLLRWKLQKQNLLHLHRALCAGFWPLPVRRQVSLF